jgi:hypothetical protein
MRRRPWWPRARWPPSLGPQDAAPRWPVGQFSHQKTWDRETSPRRPGAPGGKDEERLRAANRRAITISSPNRAYLRKNPFHGLMRSGQGITARRSRSAMWVSWPPASEGDDLGEDLEGRVAEHQDRVAHGDMPQMRMRRRGRRRRRGEEGEKGARGPTRRHSCPEAEAARKRRTGRP